MAAAEIALVARARGLGRHLFARETLETLAEADDLPAFARRLSRLGAGIDPIGEAPDVFDIDRSVGRTASRYFRTLQRWQERTPGVLDVFAADQDRRSLRALLRGAAQGAPADARCHGLQPTPHLPQRALSELARQASPAAVVGQLVMLGHPDAPRLVPLVQETQPDLFPIDIALLQGFAARSSAAASAGDQTLRDFVNEHIDVGNAQNALLIAGGSRDVEPALIPGTRLYSERVPGSLSAFRDPLSAESRKPIAESGPEFFRMQVNSGLSFVEGGRWLTRDVFELAARAVSQEAARATLTTALATSPLAQSLPVAMGDLVHLDREFLSRALDRFARIARLEPLSTAPLLHMLLRVDAQSRDLRTLAWGAVFGTPPSLRKQQLVTPP